MLLDGEWRDDDPALKSIGVPRRSVGFHLNSLYSPWLTWGDIAEKFVKAKDRPDKLQNFRNSWLALPWVEQLHKAEEDEILSHRTDYPPLIVPSEALVLTAGIDVQKEGFYYVIRAWARDYTSWLIRYGYIVTWENLYQIIFEDTYPIHGSDTERLHIWRAAIDTGGSEGGEEGVSSTEEVYTWLRKHGQGVAFGVKGASRKLPGRLQHSVIDKMPGKTSKVIPGGIILWSVDTVKFKEVFHYRLQVERGQSQSIYLHSETGTDYARHITAEEKRRNRKGEIEWHQLRDRNDYLDCEVYCAATVDPEWWGGLMVLQNRPAQPTEAPQPKAKGNGWIRPRSGGWIRR